MEAVEGGDRAVDAGVVDVEMGHQAYLRQVADRGADAVRLEMRGQRRQTRRRDFDEHHVGVLRVDADRCRVAQAGCQARGACVVFGQTIDMMVECMQAGRGKEMASVYNDVLALFLPFFTTADPLLILEPGAAIISKTASDTVAAIIEGLADWRNNRRLRYWDYETKLQRLFDCYAKLELAFPDQDILSLLSRPEEFTRLTSTEARSLQVESIINALDLMYFWLYQPCAQQTLTSILRTMTREERVIVARSQGILSRVREVSQLFVDGLLGRNFARALSFYLDSYENYILTLNKRCAGFSNGHRPLLRRRRHISDCL